MQFLFFLNTFSNGKKSYRYYIFIIEFSDKIIQVHLKQYGNIRISKKIKLISLIILVYRAQFTNIVVCSISEFFQCINVIIKLKK